MIVQIILVSFVAGLTIYSIYDSINISNTLYDNDDIPPLLHREQAGLNNSILS